VPEVAPHDTAGEDMIKTKLAKSKIPKICICLQIILISPYFKSLMNFSSSRRSSFLIANVEAISVPICFSQPI
jgi:hypothetical protein